MGFERRWVREGAVLAGEEHPGQQPSVILLHGWCCDRSFLAPQADHFSALGRHVIALDLRGHGQSSRGADGFGLGAIADDVAWLIDTLDLGRVMIAGHSMGGVVALEVANRRADRVERIAMFDSPVAVPEPLLPVAESLSGRLDSPQCGETIAEFVERWLLSPHTEPRLARRAVDTMRLAPREVAVPCWESLLAYDDRSALQACEVPVLFVAAENSLAEVDELPRLNPRVELARMFGVSHFHPLEAPAATNQLLERFFQH